MKNLKPIVSSINIGVSFRVTTAMVHSFGSVSDDFMPTHPRVRSFICTSQCPGE